MELDLVWATKIRVRLFTNSLSTYRIELEGFKGKVVPLLFL